VNLSRLMGMNFGLRDCSEGLSGGRVGMLGYGDYLAIVTTRSKPFLSKIGQNRQRSP
jgi:hypothetical protein